MNRSVLALTLLVSFFFPTASYAEWVKVAEDDNGNLRYIDTNIKNQDGHIYFWQLTDILKPETAPLPGILSIKLYLEADCWKFRFRFRQVFLHKQPMGAGSGDVLEPPNKSDKAQMDKWKYPAPSPGIGVVIEAACKMAKNQ